MNRIIRNFSLSLLVVAAVTGFGLVTSCNITGVGPSGATGGLNLLLTDGPTDDWQEVTVVLKSVSLHSREGNSWEDVWAADPANPASGTVNLVDLSGVTAILEKAMIPVGTYNLLKLVIDTDPATMTLVDENTTWTSLQPAALEPRFQTEVPPLPLSLLPGLYRLSNAVCRPQERPCSICSKYLDGSPPCGLDLLCSARLLVLQGLFGSSLRLSTCDGSFV